MASVSLRQLGQSDLEAALALLRDSASVASVAAYAELLASVVEAAALTPDAEQRGLVAEVDGAQAALAVYGEFAGAIGAGRLHVVVVARQHRRRGIATSLLERVGEELAACAARFILVELPDERPSLSGYFNFLQASGFIEESHIPDFYRTGVGLVFLRRGCE